MRLLIEGTGAVRQAYWLQVRLSLKPGARVLDEIARQGLDRLHELTDIDPSPRAFRILALARFTLGDPGWRSALLSMRAGTPRRTLAEADREIAQWAFILERPPATAQRPRPAPDPRRIEEARAFIRSLRMGWYEHLAFAALHENHGTRGDAERRRRLALRSTDRLTVLAVATGLIGLSGMALWIVAGIYIALKLRARRPLPARLPPLPMAAARALTLVGASYFAGLIAIRLASPLTARLLAAVTPNEHAIAARAVANIAFSCAALLPPLLAFRWIATPLGVELRDVGLARLRALHDLPAAAVGYAAALPLLALSLAVSASLFDASGSRMNPAVMDFAAAHTLAPRLMLLALGVIVAPLTEEFVFRGVLLRALQPTLGFGGSLLLTSAVFAILHPQLPMGFLSIFVLGVVFGGLYGFTRSLWPSILAHAVNNAVVFAYLALYLGG